MSFEIQQRIKNNAKDIKQYLNDLYQWQQQHQQKPTLSTTSSQPTQPTPPVPSHPSPPHPLQSTNQQFKTLKRDINTVSEYYKAWDKFDVDSELKVLDKQSQPPLYNPYQNSKNNIRAKPKQEMAIKGGRTRVEDPTSLKDKGNMYFKSCEFDKAIECYTECLSKLPSQSPSNQPSEINELKVIVLSNRAMARLKRNQLQQAVSDCTLSLSLDGKFIKSYLRRGEAYQRLKKWKLAKGDYERIRELEPENVTVVGELKRVNRVLEASVEEAHRKLVVGVVEDGNLNTERIEIVEVEEGEKEGKEEGERNYLEEL